MPEAAIYTEIDSDGDALVYNLHYLMDRDHITEAELARKTTIPQSTLHKILTGETSNPRIATIKLLARHFNISIDDLYLSNHALSILERPKTQSIPIISWIDCTKGLDYINSLSPRNWDNWLVTEPLSKYAYGLVSKPSMEPHIPRNTTLIISPETTPSDGDFVVVHYTKTGEATLRELTIDGPSTVLIPLSQNAKKDSLSPQISILGVVIQSRFAYQR